MNKKLILRLRLLEILGSAHVCITNFLIGQFQRIQNAANYKELALKMERNKQIGNIIMCSLAFAAL
jgi:hypothetical protein